MRSIGGFFKKTPALESDPWVVSNSARSYAMVMNHPSYHPNMHARDVRRHRTIVFVFASYHRRLADLRLHLIVQLYRWGLEYGPCYPF